MRIRTGYSFKNSFGHLEDVAERIKELGWPTLPISDRLSTFAYVEWTKLAKKMEMQPLYGVELPVAVSYSSEVATDWWTIFAMDSLKPLNSLVREATGGGNNAQDDVSVTTKEPMCLYKNVLPLHMNGVLVIVSETTDLNAIVDWWDNSSKCDLPYVAMSPSFSKGQYKRAKELGFDFIACPDNNYPRAEDRELYRLALGRNSRTQTYPTHIVSDEELAAALYFVERSDLEKSITNRNALLKGDLLRAQLKVATLLKPQKNATLREMCEAGAPERGIDLTDPVYRDRLTRELDMIKTKDFEDYFYIIADMVNWAKERMIVGPARGSSCGSLACYLLGITAIDPIPYNLIFERFIDITRKDLPDIDIDFSDVHRAKVFEYAEQKYGRERVARLGTVTMFQPKSILNAAGMGLRIPQWMIDRLLDGLIERSSGDSRALQQLEDTLKDTEYGRKLLDEFPEIAVAQKMEGHPQNSSQHAAGIVITEEPVIEYVAVDNRTGAAMCDKYDAETLNLLKIDALGLTQLSIFERTLELIGQRPVSGWLETIPLDDPLAFDVLNKGHFSGIFQFMGGALQSLVKQIEVNHIEDMISITALARPGPIISGGANEWVKRRNGSAKIEYPHPLFEPFLNNTLGIVVYQEQVMQIGREIGDLSWEDVTALRKAMSKSLGKEFFNQYGDRWKTNAAKKGIDEHKLEKIWDDLCAYGSWSFNRSHSVAYGLVSYWCCWLKAHHPVEFASATLDAESDPGRQILLLRELKSEGIDYVPVDPEHSTDKWEPVERDGKKVLVGPLTSIKGIGPATVAKILTHRIEIKNGTTNKPLGDGIVKKLSNAKTKIDTIFPVTDAIKRVDLEALKIFSEPTPISSLTKEMDRKPVLIIGVLSKIGPGDENEPIRVAKRNGRIIKGQTKFLNLFVRDDTDEIFAKINRYKFEQWAPDVIKRGRAGKAIYAIKGSAAVSPDFRMVWVDMIRYITDLDDDAAEKLGTGKILIDP